MVRVTGKEQDVMTKGMLLSVLLVRGSDGLGVRVDRLNRKTHLWRVRDMTDASFFRLQRALVAMRADVTFDDDTITVVYYPQRKGTGR